MNYLHQLVLYRTVTPLHVGCGQDVGVVDLPVIRERITGYPYIPGSGTRGALRAVFEAAGERALVDRLFGPSADQGAPRHAGCIAVHDAKLLLFPVRSDVRPYLWVTCEAAIRRLEREAEVLAPENLTELSVTANLRDGFYLGPDFGSPQGIHLEELHFPHATGDEGIRAQRRTLLREWGNQVGNCAGIERLGASLVLLTDRDFHHFVTHATVVLQHNRLTSAKTVAKGQLFSVEAVPPEAVFFGFLGATDPREPLPELATGGAGEEQAAEPEASLAPAESPATNGALPENRHQALARLLEGPEGCWKTHPSVLHLGGDEATGLGVTRLAPWPPPAPPEDGAER